MGTNKSVTAGQHDFARAAAPQIQRSSFDRSCGYKTTLDAGYLVPFFVDEALPGDTFTMNTTVFGRVATLVRPIMDNIYADTFFFAVPIRLLWANWEKFMGAQDNPGDSTDFLIPTMNAPATTGWTIGSLGDYFGIPTGIADLTHSSLWFRAYNLIWNEWFRSEDLQNSLVVDTDDGPDLESDYVLQKRGKRHDYFTSCLPWPQKGDSVDLPLGATAPVVGTGDSSPDFSFGATTGVGLKSVANKIETDTSVSDNSLLWDDPKLVADLSSATAATINQLRQAFQIQRLLERDARGGTRYTEVIRSHFGVISPDQRLQRPEYLGGASYPLMTREVAATNNINDKMADLAAYGTFVGQGSAWTKSFSEHCVIVGLIMLRADLNYQQGLERMWSRSTKYDFYWPSLAHLGEQAVLNKEIYAQGDANDDLVFGYQERFAEYRYKPSRITGLFRSTAATSLDVWHLAQEFSALPTLGNTFIQEDPPLARVIAVPSEPQFLLDSYFSLRCARPMPVYSVPGLIDHF